MAYKIKDPKIASLIVKHKAGKKASKKKSKKKTGRRKKSAKKRRSAPKSLQHIPAKLLRELGYVKSATKNASLQKNASLLRRKPLSARAPKRQRPNCTQCV